MADAAAFLTMLPQFSSVEVATVEAWLDEAANDVSVEVLEADYDRAHIYLTAHKMSMAGIGPERAAAALVGIKSFSSGGISITKEDRTRMGDFALSSFGRSYWPILIGHRGGIRITGTGYAPGDDRGWPHSHGPD